MSLKLSTTTPIVACCLALPGLVACSAEDVATPAAEAPPSEATPSFAPSSSQESERADALGDLALAASQHATEKTALLLIVNETAHRVLLTSGDAKNTATIDPGKSVRLVSARACDWLPLTATSSAGLVETYAEPCHGQTWTIAD